MPYETVAAYWCTCKDCEHEWLAVVIPSRCAKCKSRKWNGEKLPAKHIKKEAQTPVTPGPIEPPTKRTRQAPTPEPSAAILERLPGKLSTERATRAVQLLGMSKSDALRAMRDPTFKPR